MINTIQDILVEEEKVLDLYTKNVVSSDMNKHEIVYQYAVDVADEWFENGKGLRGNNLRHYTTGNWIDQKANLKHLGFEGFSLKIIHKALEVFNLTHRSKVNASYFEGKLPDGQLGEQQRMDHHVWIDDKVVILEEDRAWMDKPFYLQKRAVVKRFMVLDYCKKNLSSDVKFIFHTLQRDIKPETRRTADLIDGFGEHIVECNLSGMKRKARKYNYFDNGVDYDELSMYVKTLCEVFEKYEE
tara:strand:- start:949 stop:1674 length:726 start_codon:yes stop_codon:yes gene_type:complete